MRITGLQEHKRGTLISETAGHSGGAVFPLKGLIWPLSSSPPSPPQKKKSEAILFSISNRSEVIMNTDITF